MIFHSNVKLFERRQKPCLKIVEKKDRVRAEGVVLTARFAVSV
jgi:hypothetical protein